MSLLEYRLLTRMHGACASSNAAGAFEHLFSTVQLVVMQHLTLRCDVVHVEPSFVKGLPHAVLCLKELAFSVLIL